MSDEIEMTAEEFFGVPDFGKTSRGNLNLRKKKGKGEDAKRFAKIKVKMVMRLYGVSCARAIAIIAGRAAEKARLEREKEHANAEKKKNMRKPEEDDLLKAAGIFVD